VLHRLNRPPAGLRRDISIGAAVLILLLATVLLLSELREYHDAVDNGQNRAQTVADLLAGQSDMAARTVVATLRAVSRTVDSAGLADGALLFRLVNQEAREQPGVRSFLVVAQDGHVLADSENPRPRPLNFAGHAFVERHRASAGEEMAVDIELGDASMPAAIIFSRRLTARDGAFAGVAAAVLDPAYFTDQFRPVARNAVSEILLLHADGTLLARYPRLAAQDSVGAKLPIGSVEPGGQPGNRLFGGGEPRLIGFARLDRFPLAGGGGGAGPPPPAPPRVPHPPQ
jgi:hypothetical protein